MDALFFRRAPDGASDDSMTWRPQVRRHWLCAAPLVLALAFAVACKDDQEGDSPTAGDASSPIAGDTEDAGSSGEAGAADDSDDAPDDPSEDGSAAAGTAGAPDGTAGAPADDEDEAGVPADCVSTSDDFTWPAPATMDVPEDPSWKAELDVPLDPFFSFPQGPIDEVRWAKFIVLTADPSRVYFQDAFSAPFHYEFARDHIPAFADMTRAEFDAVSLNSEGREAILGAVLIPADSVTHPEYGVQLVSNDDLHPALVATVMKTIADHVTTLEGTRALYMPDGISAECVDSKREDLQERGVAVGKVDRWLLGDACYAPGWAIGKLVQLAADEVDTAYLEGRLSPDDILLLSDSAPAELPYVAGILTLEPSTPNAHAAILARSYGVPFAYLRTPEAAAAATARVGTRVVLSTTGAAGRDPFDTFFGDCDIRFVDVQDLSDEELAGIHALAEPPAIAVTPKVTSNAYTLPIDMLVPADIERVGGKAAHFGLLRAAAPEVTPTPAIALTFDLWDAFMAQPAPDGAEGTLADEIARRLAAHRWPVDVRALETTLEGVRDLIKDAPFPDPLSMAVGDALSEFDPAVRIRFRSSTNVEDSETFTGAGLYDSVTGCFADDLDDDDEGPSLCNPDEEKEHGVFRAIRRVYASFYFRNAYLERLRRGVDETQVGMGVLVHYSVPDPQELANGVATLTLDEFAGRTAEMVSQLGAVSVTNPDGSALPESVRIDRYEEDDFLSTPQTSSLVPLGAHVMTWEDDYRTFMDLFNRVADRYADVTGKQPPFALDFEYKKVEPGVLSLRQVRPLPLPDTTRNVTPFLVGEPITLCVYGSERADAFATHRLKVRIALQSANLHLTSEQLQQALYQQARIEYLDGAVPDSLAGSLSELPGADHALEETEGDRVVVDGWSAADGSWSLRTRVPSLLSRDENPVRTPADFFFDLDVTWSEPMPFLTFGFEDGQGFVAETRTEESVELWPFCPDDVMVDDRFQRIDVAFEGPEDLRIEAGYWYPPPPQGATAGYTAPAIKWDRTTITGLTSEPLVLTGYFSQTYAPYHHNFGGQYIFDPRLEPDLPASTAAELVAADVAFLVVIDNDGIPDELWAMGMGGTLRRL